VFGSYMLAVRLTRTSVGDWFATHGLRVLAIVIAMIAAKQILQHAVPPAVRRSVYRNALEPDRPELEKRAETLSHVLVRLAIAGIFLIGIFIVLSEVGYNIAPVITGLGISGIAIGLGAQSMVKDTINGIFILGENQYRRGDSVTIAGVSGIVEDITLRRTVLRDIDGSVHSVPNSSIQVSTNLTRDYSGVSVAVLISHATNLEQAIKIAAQTGTALNEDPNISADVLEPPLPARIETIDEKGIMLRMIGKVRPGAQARVGFEYRRRLTEAFDAAGIRYTVAAPPPAVPRAGPG